jgi:hypothetical protein
VIEGAELTSAWRWCRVAPVVGEVGHASRSCSEVIGCSGHASGSAPQPTRQLTVVGGQVDIEVVRALDGWLARRWEFASEDTRRGVGEDLGKDGANRWAPSVSDGDAVSSGKLAHAQGWLGSASSFAGHGENGPRRFFPIQILFPIE